MEIKTRATQVGGTVRLDLNTKDADILNTYYIDIAEAGRLKENDMNPSDEANRIAGRYIDEIIRESLDKSYTFDLLVQAINEAMSWAINENQNLNINAVNEVQKFYERKNRGES